ncbi:MAG: SpoIIE family protein phosphatase [Phycisphaeraceae bacterium]|nr:SpoIIE family protein phosphatase [Phycisphaeraceae bacterium]MCB9847387.1 SpoIIE family protein phosphatase [Phycisphaeraceae bacterium]
MSTIDSSQPRIPLRLKKVSGPPIEPLEVAPTGRIVIGRSSGSEVQLNDPMISRRHARIGFSGGDWIIEDLGSRHGTEINGVRLPANSPSPLADYDQVSLGPWTFSVRTSADKAVGESTIGTSGTGGERVERIVSSDLGALAKERLDLIMDCAAAIQGASDLRELADHVLEVAVAGTGFSRAALAQPIDSFDSVELLGCRDRDGATGGEISISRTMLREASRGELVRMADAPDMQQAMSIISLGITSAICCPVIVGRRILAYLYLDTLRDTSGVQPDAASFCHTIARMTGMAIATVERSQLERRQQRFEADLQAAREVQQRMMPAESDTIDTIRYAMKSRPGRVIAGDLFDITPIDENRTAFFLGDVSGKGMPAAMLMGMAQSNLAAALRHDPDLGRAVTEVNRQVHARSSDREFITLFAGIYDRARREIEFVDAGHGYGLRCHAGGDVERIVSEGGLPLGIDPSGIYRPERLTGVEPGSRIVVFSDGVVEQTGPVGEEFGVDRVIELLRSSSAVETDVASLLDAIIEYAETDALSDDVTIVSIEPL